MNQSRPIMELDPIYFHKEFAVYHPVNNPLMQTDALELAHFKQVVATFYNYAHDMKFEIRRIENYFSALPPRQLQLLRMNYQERVEALRQAVEKNAFFFFLIVAAYIDLFPEADLHNVAFVRQLPVFTEVQPSDIAKLRITLKQFYRDWSKEGQLERDQCYKPIIEKLLQYFP